MLVDVGQRGLDGLALAVIDRLAGVEHRRAGPLARDFKQEEVHAQLQLRFRVRVAPVVQIVHQLDDGVQRAVRTAFQKQSGLADAVHQGEDRAAEAVGHIALQIVVADDEIAPVRQRLALVVLVVVDAARHDDDRAGGEAPAPVVQIHLPAAGQADADFQAVVDVQAVGHVGRVVGRVQHGHQDAVLRRRVIAAFAAERLLELAAQLGFR